MNDILEIFKGNFVERDTIIKPVSINVEMHKIGFTNILKHLVPDFVIDENNREIIAKLFNYFIGNLEFCQNNDLDLNKGLLLYGGVGTGKTIILEAFRLYTGNIIHRNSFQIHYSSDVIDSINVNGVSEFDKYALSTYCIDDICSKNETVKNYGTEINTIEQLIGIRYNVYQKIRKLTHFSTNIYPSEMHNYYDQRIIDRLAEMCNLIELPGKSRRK